MNKLQKVLLALVAVMCVSLLSIPIRAASSGATRYVKTIWSNTITSVATTNIYATTTNGVVYLNTNVVTAVNTNSTALYVHSDNASQVTVWNNMGAGNVLFVSQVNPVTNSQGWAIANAGSLTFPFIAGGDIPSVLFGVASNNTVAITNGVTTEVWDSDRSK